MEVILTRSRRPGRLLKTLALGLVLLSLTFLVACTGDDPTPTAQEVQPTATSTSAPATATPAPTDTPSRPPTQVVATTNFVADWARVVGGDRVDVFSLHSPGADPHNLVPGAGDVAKVADADLVLSVGLGLEAAWLENLVHNASADESRIVALGEGVDPLEFVEVHAHHDEHDDHMDEGGEHMDEHGAAPQGRLADRRMESLKPISPS